MHDSAARSSAQTHKLIVECALGGGIFGAEAAPTGVITFEQIKQLLGPEYVDFASALFDEMNADQDEDLTVEEFGAFVGKHAERNMGFTLATAAAAALTVTEEAGGKFIHSHSTFIKTPPPRKLVCFASLLPPL